MFQATKDRVKERRATRGLAACARKQGQLRQAVKHLERVLYISREIRDFVGDADAYGTIAGGCGGVAEVWLRGPGDQAAWALLLRAGMLLAGCSLAGKQ
jgi:hypothetical protein